ncbi:MAG: Histone acetyltransferase, ELP3 family [Candidatus Moranbacteria bacterium GW2011_GWA2_39_41]|nr:MAG: Histone acetyltransferase, ELP3 family [Candidatus Moranbacteria bacterium GW2011_GWA2_39_41]
MEAGVTDSQAFSRRKKDICKKLGVQPPTNADLREHYEKMIAKKELKRSPLFEKILLSKKIRTESGVAVVAVLTKAYPCPGQCIYCPSEKDMPKSYLSNEPAVMRAISAKFNPYKQIHNRLRALELNGHQIDKIELIVMGGTFNYLPNTYQTRFIKECFRAANEYKESRKVHQVIKSIKSADEKLLYEQKKNEQAKHRIIGLTLETRPDYINKKEIVSFRRLGCTRVELGVQNIFDDVLELNKRGHLVSETIRATKMLKDAGFKINYHMMPGLPGSTPKRDFEMFKALLEGPEFQPDMLKIYPTVVLKNSKLYDIWKNKKYVPLTNPAFEKLVVKIKNEAIAPYVRIARLIRDVPTPSIIAGPTVSNLRQIIIPQSKCPCIRCREVKSGYIIGENIILDRIDYPASDGQEIFLQYVSSDKSASGHGMRLGQKLFALLRLRIPSENNKRHFIPALRNSAIIREVHTYGKLAKLNESSKSSPQHIGLGKKLIQEAERIAKEEYGLEKIVVISGVGVRGYYRKLGYKLKNTYLIKNL